MDNTNDSGADKHRADVLKKAIYFAKKVYAATDANQSPSPAVIAQMFATLLVESRLNTISYRLHLMDKNGNS